MLNYNKIKQSQSTTKPKSLPKYIDSIYINNKDKHMQESVATKQFNQ